MSCADPVQDIEIEEVIPHIKFRHQYDDIALIRLSRPANMTPGNQFNNNTMPIYFRNFHLVFLNTFTQKVFVRSVCLFTIVHCHVLAFPFPVGDSQNRVSIKSIIDLSLML